MCYLYSCAVSDVRAEQQQKGITMETRIARSEKVRMLTLAAMLTAIVVVLQLLGSFIRFGTFSISLVLIPIVIGASLLGWQLGAWLGFVFSVVVLLSGDAAPFLAVNTFGTILTVLLKGTLAGLVSGLVYRTIADKGHPLIAVYAAAVVCPIVNTGVFLIGCRIFFWDTICGWGAAAGFRNVGAYIIGGLVGGNFLFELLFNVVLSPVVVRLVQIWQGKRAADQN